MSFNEYPAEKPCGAKISRGKSLRGVRMGRRGAQWTKVRGSKEQSACSAMPDHALRSEQSESNISCILIWNGTSSAPSCGGDLAEVGRPARTRDKRPKGHETSHFRDPEDLLVEQHRAMRAILRVLRQLPQCLHTCRTPCCPSGGS
jgi:hypothetical protein